MKNLILLFLVIGAVVSTAIVLTNTTDAAKAEWTLTYVTPATTSVYNSFTLSYDSGNGTTSAALINGDANSIGVVCIPTSADFALATPGTARPAYSFSVLGTGTGTATPSLNTQASVDVPQFAALLLTYHPLMTYTTADSVATSAAGNIDCALTGAGAADIVVASGILTWTFTVAAACGNLPKMGTDWYARCFAVKDQNIEVSKAGGETITALIGAKDVSIVTTTTCATTAGASTFATGATILAGIAYLQF
jgi:hypothetical protein